MCRNPSAKMRIWQKTDICHNARTGLIKGHFREVRRYEKSLHCLHIAGVAGSIPAFLPLAFPTPTPRLCKGLSNKSFHATCYAILENSKLRSSAKGGPAQGGPSRPPQPRCFFVPELAGSPRRRRVALNRIFALQTPPHPDTPAFLSHALGCPIQGHLISLITGP